LATGAARRCGFLALELRERLIESLIAGGQVVQLELPGVGVQGIVVRQKRIVAPDARRSSQ
jgi:hypothetical protein